MHPILRPGTHVLARPAGELQVGLDPRDAVVLPDTEPVRSSLRLLAGSAARRDHVDAGTVQLLAGQNLLIDQRDLIPLLGPDQDGPVRHAAAALARTDGPDTSAALRARRRSRVQVHGFGHPIGAAMPQRFTELLLAAGFAEPGPPRRRPTRGSGADTDPAVLLGVGEPDRELVDGWARTGTPYLLVRMREGRAVVGPFVVPGRTACLRCVDAHWSDVDRAWPLLVKQYAAATRQDRSDGAPEPLDPLLVSVALSWAARDMASFVDGRRPSTWSSTLTLDPHLTDLETRSWLRHPGCGCSWA